MLANLKTLTASQGEAIANSTKLAAYAGEVVALKGSLASTEAKAEQNKDCGLTSTLHIMERLVAVETKASVNEGVISKKCSRYCWRKINS